MWIRIVRYSVILIIFSWILPVLTAQAFEVKTASEVGPTAYLKWDSSQGPVPITLNAAGTPDMPMSTVQTDVQRALAAWQNVPGQSLRFQYAGASSSAVPNDSDGINSIVWVSGWQYPSSILAVTRYSYYIDSPPHFADADILINDRDYKWTDALQNGGGTADVQQVLIHELGHLTGLAHTSVLSALMYPYLSSKVTRTLNVDDKSGLQFLYGAVPASFSAITPVANAIYVEQMVQNNLPMPVFRWGTDANTSFTIEFAATSSFTTKVSYPAGSSNFFALQSTQVSKLISLSPKKTIYWRIVAGSTTTVARKLSFKSLS